MSVQSLKPLRPYSRPIVLASIDGRSHEARIMRRVRGELVAHCGGKPSATQRALIERATMLSLHLHMMDERILGHGMTTHDSNQYLAWSNSLDRTMRHLGLQGASERPATLAEIAARSKSA